MAEQTTNYDLIKPEYDDTADIKDINDNMDALDTILNGMKEKQTAVTDPTASGTAVAFIDSIAQDADGVITPTKKTVANMGGATSGANGTAGLVPAPLIADKEKFLKGDGSWAVPTDTQYSAATSSALGLIKIGYSQNSKNYPVVLDANNKAYVNVPWTDTNTTYSSATSGTYGLVKVGYSTNGKNYAVQLNSSGQMFVNVPWTDTNTTYSNMRGATSSAAGASGLVPAPSAGQNGRFLRGDGTWQVPTNTWRGFVRVTHNANYSVGANGNVDISANAFGLGYSGYTAVAIYLFNPGNFNCVVANVRTDVTGNNAVMNIKNLTGSAQTGTAYLGVLYLQN